MGTLPHRQHRRACFHQSRLTNLGIVNRRRSERVGIVWLSTTLGVAVQPQGSPRWLLGRYATEEDAVGGGRKLGVQAADFHLLHLCIFADQRRPINLERRGLSTKSCFKTHLGTGRHRNTETRPVYPLITRVIAVSGTSSHPTAVHNRIKLAGTIPALRVNAGKQEPIA